MATNNPDHAAGPSAAGSSDASLPPQQGSPSRRQRPLAATPFRSFATRLLLAISGLGLIVGFFMPWAVLAEDHGGSGFDILIGRTELLELIFEPTRPVLLLVPMLGAMLLVGAWTGHRASLWVALAAGVTVIGYGLYTLIRVFLQSTGFGMWLVVASALVAVAVGLLALGRSSSTAG